MVGRPSLEVDRAHVSRFQSIEGNSTQQSSIHTLPFVISTTIISLVAGGLTVVIGYYNPALILGTICISIGAGLLMTLKVDSATGYW